MGRLRHRPAHPEGGERLGLDEAVDREVATALVTRHGAPRALGEVPVDAAGPEAPALEEELEDGDVPTDVVSKFADHLPLYRQQGILARHGVDLSPSTLGGWVAAAADLLKPLVVRMAELVRQSRVIQTDDTPVPVLDPGSRRTKTGHLWVYLGDADHPYAVFDFTPTYSGDGPRAWLGDYAGYVQADALRQYDAAVRPPAAAADGGRVLRPRPPEVPRRAGQ